MKNLIILIAIICSTSLFAQDAKSIVGKFKTEMEATDQEVTLTMQLVGKSGSIRERSLSWSTMKAKTGLSSSYLLFTAPADIKGTAFLSQENATGNDDQWLFLPALKRSRRISSNEKGQSFMGSDFTYDDLGEEDTNKSTYKLLKSEPTEAGTLQVIAAVYTDQQKIKESGYSKRIITINEKTNMLLKTEFYGTDGKLKKVLECAEFKQFGDQKRWRPMLYQMKNLEKGTETILKFGDYKIDKGIDANRFTIRNLESN
ncbi:MAG TPA: outer membrane lipoprotein-sorting protein [Prolixibacteraceae bacterium]|nr:outer membrane lipoprotein-sorting protein [Prolixibacteraceae bacterium]